eukprot:12211494-Alexandrium_andersonii.AAC.1
MVTGLHEDLGEVTAFEAHAEAVDLGARIFTEAGSRVSADKSNTLGTTEGLRSRWRRHVVEALGQPTRVLTTVRDLGAQMNLGRKH